MRGNLTNIRMGAFNKATVHPAKCPANSGCFGKIIEIEPEEADASQD